MKSASDKSGKSTQDAQRSLEVKVGAFVLLTAVVGAGVVFLLGAKQRVFEQHAILHAKFPTVEGLKEGAPVRLSGVNVGTVSRVAFSTDKSKSEVDVDIEVARDALARIGQDSVARIGTQGLLGDKIIDVSMSGPNAQPLRSGDTIQTQAPADFNRLITQAGEIMEKAKTIADNVAVAMAQLADPRTVDGIRAAIATIRQLLHRIEVGPGLAHALFYDKKTEDHFRQLAGAVGQLIARVDKGVERVDNILAHVDDDGVQLVNNVSRAAKHIGETAEDIHKSQLVTHLSRASGDVADMTAHMKKGQGTLGALIVDPTVYEQLVTVLGGVGRSRTLRALVRFAIARNNSEEGHETARIVDGKQLPAFKSPDAPPAEQSPPGTREAKETPQRRAQ